MSTCIIQMTRVVPWTEGTVAVSSDFFQGECTAQAAILCLSEKNRGQRSKRMVISSLGCVCFHFTHVCADKV